MPDTVSAKSGTEHHHSGPHLLGPKADEEPITPGPGTCYGCGDKFGVMEFTLVRQGKAAGIWRLCPACYEWGCPRDPREADPLSA